MDGWVKNHRKIEEWKYYKVPGYAHLWQHVLRQAHHSDTPIFDGYGNEIKKGQFSTGRNKLGKETGLNASKVQRILKCLEIEHQIAQQNKGKCRIITIVNWHLYQEREQVIEHQVNISRTSSEHQVNISRTHNKNAKNVKNVKNNISPKIEIPGLEPEVTNWLDSVKDEMRQKWLDVYPVNSLIEEIDKAYGWNFDQKKSKQKKDIGRFLSNWFKRSDSTAQYYRNKVAEGEFKGFVDEAMGRFHSKGKGKIKLDEEEFAHNMDMEVDE